MPDSSPSLPPSVWEPLRPVILGWRRNPTLFVTQALKTAPEPWQAKALAALAAHDRVAIRSGHGVGKSALLAWVLLWWLLTRFPAKIACTAPTAHQLADVLWGEIAKWHRRLEDPFRDWLRVKADRVELASAPNESFAVARTSRKEEPEALQGFHSENMLFLIDEASGVEDIVFEVGEGAMSTAGAKTLMTGNPTRPSGYFHAAFHKMRARWKTLKVSGEDCTLVSRDYVADMAARYGRESNIFRVRVLGEFPVSEDGAVIALHLCEAAKVRTVAPLTAFRPVWGVDVARFGGDRSALALRRGNVQLAPVRAWQGHDTMQTAGLIAEAFRATPEDEQPSEILVDVIGIGAGVVDRLREQGLPVRGINVAEEAATGGRFLRLRDELWWRAREWLAGRDTRLAEDDALIAELTAPRYQITSSGKIKIESKDEMKRRGLASPDLADAFVLTFAGGLLRADEEVPPRYGRGRTRGGGWMGV